VAATIEIVRFEVAPERRQELLAGHLGARRAIHALSPPGALWSRLTRVGERGWIEIVAWERRELFDRALELSAEDPVARPWFDLASPGYMILLGETEDAPPLPPREGALELEWALEDAAPAEGDAEPGWSLRVEIGTRAWVDASGWVERAPMTARMSEAPEGSSAPFRVDPPAPFRERVAIAHAVDAAEETPA